MHDIDLENKENIIMWEKWSDPYAEDLAIDEHESLEETYEDYEEEYEDLEPEQPSTVQNIGKFRAIATPMGIIPINESTASSKIFNFWVGHANFDITNAIAIIIEDTDGVETLDVFTRYRFRIGIGKAFNDSSVMRKINSRVYEYLL